MIALLWLASSLFPRPRPPVFGFRLLQTFPHDPSAFTQGLYFEPEGTLVESTGLYGRSSIRRVDLESGRVLRSEQLPSEWFGEGVTAHGDTFIQLLWREGLILERDAKTFALLRSYPLPHGIREGWGATTDGKGTLYVSDGTSTLHALSLDSMKPMRRVMVQAGGRQVRFVNELQWVQGEIWANIYGMDLLAAIDPMSGQVRCFVDLESILSREERSKCDVEEVRTDRKCVAAYHLEW